MSNSSLVSYVKKSPNYFAGRKHSICRISPHCVVGQCTIETLGNVFANPSKRASSNYGIAKDGRIGLFVDEKDHSWCTSDYLNDDFAITIECASDMTAPYAFNAIVYKQLIELCADICRRNGKKKLLWFANKNTALSYKPSSDEMVLTVHRWFANKSCPGDWLMARMSDLAKQVNAKLSSSSSSVPSSSKTEMTKKGTVKATGVARAYKKSIAGTYVTTDELNVRNNAGVKNSVIGVLPKGTKCHCYGYYSNSGLTKWYYIVATVGTTQYIGFVSSAYLRRA